MEGATSWSRAALTGSDSKSVLIGVWSKGHFFWCSFIKHCLQAVWPQPNDIGVLTASLNSLKQMGQDKKSVHCGD